MSKDEATKPYFIKFPFLFVFEISDKIWLTLKIQAMSAYFGEFGMYFDRVLERRSGNQQNKWITKIECEIHALNDGKFGLVKTGWDKFMERMSGVGYGRDSKK